MNTNRIASAIARLRALLPILSGTFAAAAAIGIVLFVPAAKGQYSANNIVEPPTQVFPWGNSNSVTAAAVTNTLYMGVAVSGQTSNGTITELPYITGGPYTFASEADINSRFHQWFEIIAQSATTNTSVDRSLPYVVGANMSNFDWNYDANYSYFEVHGVPFSLVYTNGEYTVPDLSGINIQLYPWLSYYVPGIQWARIETYCATNTTVPFDVADSRYSTSSLNVVDTNNEVLIMDTPIIISSDNNGLYRLKVSVMANNSFQIFNGQGMLVEETPLVPAISLSNETVNVTVTGGDAGRVFVLQKSTDLHTWSQVGGPYTVGAIANWSVTFSQPTTGTDSSGFYRTATVNAVPTQ